MCTLNGWFARSLLGAVVLVALHSPSPAQREPGRGEIRGTLKAVNAWKRTITITFAGGRESTQAEKTFALAKNLEVCVARPRGPGVFTAAKLADLAKGLTVRLGMSVDLKTVDNIIAEEPLVRGVLKALDRSKKTLTLSKAAGREQPSEDQTLMLTSDVEVIVDDGSGRRFSQRPGKIDELAVGSFVTLQLSLDKKLVRTVVAEGTTVGGTLKALDADKRSLTLTMRPLRGEEAAEEKTLPIAKDALILTDDGKGRRLSLQEARLIDVPLGASVLVKLSVDQQAIIQLRAEGPILVGVFKSVDPDKRTITFAIPRGRANPDEKTLPLAKDVRVIIDTKEAQLGDLKAGDNGPILQLRLSLDQQVVQMIQARQPQQR